MIRFLPRLRRRREELDKRVASARARAETATAEAEKSRARQESVREHVVGPLRQAAEHNQFAQLIRDSLIEGRGRPT
jgi:hypothetical protein